MGFASRAIEGARWNVRISYGEAEAEAEVRWRYQSYSRISVGLSSDLERSSGDLMSLHSEENRSSMPEYCSSSDGFKRQQRR